MSATAAEAATMVCSRCGEEKPAAEFHGGKCCVCEACRRERQRAYDATRMQDPVVRERRREYSRQWRAANLEKKRVYNREYMAAHATEGREPRRRWCADNPERCRELGRRWQLEQKHGLTPEQYDALLASQGGGCAVCGKTPNGRALNVDHDHRHDPFHRPGQVSCAECRRGLLCDNCNHAAGLLADDPERARALGDYLAKGNRTAATAA